MLCGWGVVTLTTVGYGDVFPVMSEGRLAGAALMILGITLFAAITGMSTSFWWQSSATLLLSTPPSKSVGWVSSASFHRRSSR